MENEKVNCTGAKQTITEKVNIMKKNSDEIVKISNEISLRIFGKVPETYKRLDCDNTSNTTQKNIEDTLNNIEGNIVDIRTILNEVLKSL
jgi:hypothetical protein